MDRESHRAWTAAELHEDLDIGGPAQFAGLSAGFRNSPIAANLAVATCSLWSSATPGVRVFIGSGWAFITPIRRYRLLVEAKIPAPLGAAIAPSGTTEL
jgi:hypothetical protein